MIAVFVDTFASPVGYTMAPDYSKVTIAPVFVSEFGKHTVSIDLMDDAGAKLSKVFYVTVINGPPIFTINPFQK